MSQSREGSTLEGKLMVVPSPKTNSATGWQAKNLPIRCSKFVPQVDGVTGNTVGNQQIIARDRECNILGGQSRPQHQCAGASPYSGRLNSDVAATRVINIFIACGITLEIISPTTRSDKCVARPYRATDETFVPWSFGNKCPYYYLHRRVFHYWNLQSGYRFHRYHRRFDCRPRL